MFLFLDTESNPLDLSSERPVLIVHRSPENPIEPHTRHSSIDVPSTPDQSSDSRMVFVVSLMSWKTQQKISDYKKTNCCPVTIWENSIFYIYFVILLAQSEYLHNLRYLTALALKNMFNK
jgi:hypothetical protein